MVDSCCYYVDLRWGCFWSGIVMVLYYALMAYNMLDDLEESVEASYENIDARVENRGFWVLGITYITMSVLCLVLLLAGLLNKSWLCLVFLVGQAAPILVNSYYLLVAIIYGLALEIFILYLLPQILLIYIDMVAYSFWVEQRIISKHRKYQRTEIAVIEY